MSEKRYVRCDGGHMRDHIKDTKTDTVIGLWSDLDDIVNYLNQQADELREVQAQNAAAIVTFKRVLPYVKDIAIGMLVEDHINFDTTAGAALLTELEQLQGYRAFVHSCIKSGEVCVYTFEEYLEKMKSE